MPQSLSQPSSTDAPATGRPVVLTMALLAGVLTAMAGVLWLRHGTAVFLHTIMSGIAACL